MEKLETGINVLKLDYFNESGGHGEMEIDLDKMLPCEKKAAKILANTIRRDRTPEKTAGKVYDYIGAKVAELKKRREALKPGLNDAEIVRTNTAIKRFLAFADLLVNDYGFDKIEDDDASIKMKAVKVYAYYYDRRSCKSSVEEFDGWTFQKGGYTFDVYKNDCKRYTILLHGTGLKVAESSTKASAPVAITSQEIDAVNRFVKSATYEKRTNEYKKLMAEAGYIIEEDKSMAKTNSVAEKKTTVDELAAIKSEKDALAAELAAIKSEKDALAAELAAIKSEKDALAAELAELKTTQTTASTTAHDVADDVKRISGQIAKFKGVTLTVKGAKTSAPVVWLAGDVNKYKKELAEVGAKYSNKRKAYYICVA